MIHLLNYLPLIFAILCYVLAGAFRGDVSTHDGLLLLAGALAGAVIPRLGDLIVKPRPAASAPGNDGGHALPSLMFVFLFSAAATLVALMLFPPEVFQRR